MKVIDVDDLVSVLYENPDGEATNERFAEWLEEQEGIEITFCGDCKNRAKDLLGFVYCISGMYPCTEPLPDDFYCAKGER